MSDRQKPNDGETGEADWPQGFAWSEREGRPVFGGDGPRRPPKWEDDGRSCPDVSSCKGVNDGGCECRASWPREGEEFVRMMRSPDHLTDWLSSHGLKVEPYVEQASDTITVDFGEETITTDETTGGQKGMKPARLDLISPVAQIEEAKVYGAGASKYADHNWRLGYDWSKSFAAMQRHLLAWWGGEELDPESGLSHMAHARWHTGVLLEFAARGLGTDDRYRVFEPRPVIRSEDVPF